jgi:hypothetical protein
LVLIECYHDILYPFSHHEKTIFGHNKTTLPTRVSHGPLFDVDLFNHQTSIFVAIMQWNYVATMLIITLLLECAGAYKLTKF